VTLPNGIQIKSKILDAMRDAYPEEDRRRQPAYRLIKSLYGLASSPHLFSKLISAFLTKLGLERSRTDCTLFTKYNQTTGKWVIVTAFVDDLLICGTDTEFQATLKDALMKRFGTDLTWTEKVRSFLGLHCQQSADNYRITVTARYKIDDLFKRINHKVSQFQGASAPWSANDFKDAHERPETPLTARQLALKGEFRTVTGILIYIAITVRPDIATILNRCCQGAADPQRIHIVWLEKLLNYIHSHRDVGLIFDGHSTAIFKDVVHPLTRRYAELKDLSCMPYHCFSDANFADITGPRLRSTSGYCLYLFGSLVAWHSKRQTITAKSTLEAELIAAFSAADEAAWLHQFACSVPFLFCLQQPGAPAPNERDVPPVPVLVDNLPAIQTANHPRVTGNTKHIALRDFRIRDYSGDCDNVPRIRVYWVPTKLNAADFFSKLPPAPDFQRLARWLVDSPDTKTSKTADIGASATTTWPAFQHCRRTVPHQHSTTSTAWAVTLPSPSPSASSTRSPTKPASPPTVI